MSRHARVFALLPEKEGPNRGIYVSPEVLLKIVNRLGLVKRVLLFSMAVGLLTGQE